MNMISGEYAHVLDVVLKLTAWILDGLTHVPTQPSCTSLPSRWEKPRGTKIKAEPVSSMVLSRPKNITRKRRPITSVFVEEKLVKTKKRLSRTLLWFRSKTILINVITSCQREIHANIDHTENKYST